MSTPQGYGLPKTDKTLISIQAGGKYYIPPTKIPSWVGITPVQTKLTASNPSSYDHFGRGIGFTGDWLVVGAFQEDTGANNTGSVYMFQNIEGTYTETQILHPTDLVSYDQFGAGVAMSGNWMAACANNGDSVGYPNTGIVYMFENQADTWVQTQRIEPPFTDPNHYFGEVVSLSGNVMVIGHQNYDANTGEALVYENVNGTWTLTQRIQADNMETGSYFGIFVYVNNGVIAVSGINSKNDSGQKCGAVYMFEKQAGTWTQTQKLSRVSGDSQHSFGVGVGFDGDLMVVGDVHSSFNYGEIHIFKKIENVWTLVQGMGTPTGLQQGRFGNYVNVSKNIICVGAYGMNSYRGAVYVIEEINEAFTVTNTLSSTQASTSDYFGDNVLISGTKIAVTAFGDKTVAGTSGGAVIIIDQQ